MMRPTVRLRHLHTVVVILAAVLLHGCTESPSGLTIPEFRNGGFLSQTHAMPDESIARLEGIWAVDNGKGRLGDSVVLKVSGDRITLFARPNIMYMQLETGYLEDVVFLEGFWREQGTSSTGLVRLVVPKDNGGGFVVAGGMRPDSMLIVGSYGQDQNNSTNQVLLHWVRPISDYAKRPFAIIAHRAGGRTADLIPHSENTVELIKIAERYGANAVEIDVRLSKDGVPFLYHDNQLNPRLVQRGALVGPPENYPIAVLKNFVTLINGERIPTFQEALDAIVYETNLEYVYLDTKSENVGILSKMIPMQKAAMEAARNIPGRKPLTLVIGVPTEDVYSEFVAYPNHESVPSLIELSLDQARAVNARVWAPRWTLGTQNDLVKQAQAEGMAVVTWTLDDDAFIHEFLTQGHFNGILTNYPTLVAWHLYMQ